MKRARNTVSEGVETHPLNRIAWLTVDLTWDEGERVWVTHVAQLNHLSDWGKTAEEALDRTAAAALAWVRSSEEYGTPMALSPSQVSELKQALAA